MKKIPVKYIVFSGLATIIGGFFHACTESQSFTPDWVDSKPDISLRTDFRQGISGNGLLTRLYVFSSESGNSYRLSDSLPQVISSSTRLKISLADLNKKNYRFLFIATPEQTPEIHVRHSDNSPFAFGTEWEKVAIEMANDSLSVDNYYGIKDLTGNEILQTGTIQGELTRLVGQMLFCFYKAGPGGVSDPVPMNDKTVASVMDRISSIDITYEGVPRLITFDSGNHPVVLPGSKITLNHTIHFSLTPEGQKVPLPQTNVPVEVADSIPGGAILKGTCLLPTRQEVRVSMFFHYYDTTPICNHTETAHIHGTECFTTGLLSLRLPQNSESPGLGILPDHFTVNNAGLPCNRIIDIDHTTDIEVNTAWN